jgi:septin family protein
VQLRRFYNQNILQVYQRLCESLGSHNFILLVGPADSGKSSLFSMLLQQHRADLACLCPNAYHIDDLYGNDFSNGVVCSLIEETLKRIKRDGSRRSGILFDGEMSMWMEPLAGVVSSGHIIQPNGNTLLIQEELKFVF